jgi:hypothetical protein
VDALKAGLAMGLFIAPLAGAVRGVVVDDEHVRRRQNAEDFFSESGEVLDFVVGGQDD